MKRIKEELFLGQITEHSLTLSQLSDLFPLARISTENVLLSRGMSQEEAQFRLAHKRKWRRKQRWINNWKNRTTNTFNFLKHPFQLVLLFSLIIYFLIILFSFFYNFEEGGIINGFNLTISTHQQIQHFFTIPIISSIVSVILIQILFLLGIFIIYKFLNPFKYLKINYDNKTPTLNKKLSSTEDYTVQRGDVKIKISEKEILPGDLLIIKAGQHIPADCRILQVMEETFLVDQSCLFKLDQQKLDAIVELKSTTAPNYLDPITARNIAFASSKCINGKAFVLVLRTREETLISHLNAYITKNIKTSNISSPFYYLNISKHKEHIKEHLNNNKKTFCWLIVVISIVCSLLAATFYGYSIFLLLPNQNIFYLIIPFITTFISLLISILPHGVPLSLFIRNWYCLRYLASNKNNNKDSEFKFIQKQQQNNNNKFYLNEEMLGRTSILIIHSTSLLGGNTPILSDIWISNANNNNKLISASINIQNNKSALKLLEIAASFRIFPENSEEKEENNDNILKPEYFALLKFIKQLEIPIKEYKKGELSSLIGPPDEIMEMCSFILKENSPIENNENNFLPLREEHLIEFEEQFLRFCIQRKRCLALAIEINKLNKCFVGLFAFEDINLNIKCLNKLMEYSLPNIIFIGDEHPALVFAKVKEWRTQKRLNNVFNKKSFLKHSGLGNGIIKNGNSENVEKGNSSKEKHSFIYKLQNQLLHRLKNQKNSEFISTSTTTSISTPVTLRKSVNKNIENLNVFDEENLKWPIDGEMLNQMSTKEINKLFETFNNSNKFPLCFSRLNSEQILFIIKEIQTIGHFVTFVGDLHNSINENLIIKQSNFSIGIYNYSTKINFNFFNYFNAIIKCLEDGSGFVKLIIAIKEYGNGMKINFIRSLSYSLSQSPALLLPFLLSPFSDIPPIILPIHVVLVAFLFQIQYSIGFALTPLNPKNHQNSQSIIYFNLILTGPLLAFFSLFNYWNTLYSKNIYLNPNNDVSQFFNSLSNNSTINTTIKDQELVLKQSSTIWLFTLLICQNLHIFICLIFCTIIYFNNYMERLKTTIIWLIITLINIFLIIILIYLPGLNNLFELTPPTFNQLWWIPLIFCFILIVLNIPFHFVLNSDLIKNTKIYKIIKKRKNTKE